jgi:phosphotransferase system HPr-like phosphotransfer protein
MKEPKLTNKNGYTLVDVIVNHNPGIVGRSAASIVKCCSTYPLDINVGRLDGFLFGEEFKPYSNMDPEDIMVINAKSIMSLMMLAMEMGAKVRIMVKGENELAKKYALDLYNLFSSNIQYRY